MSFQWYLARTKPLCEYKACVALERNGYELFSPLVRTPWRRFGRQDVPLFPGYLFVRRDRNALCLAPLNRIEGMIGWVQFDGIAPEVPNEVILELTDRLKLIDRQGGSWKRFQPGDRVRVNSGWIDALGEVLEEPVSPDSRIRVLLEFMGGLVRAHVPCRDLQSVDKTLVRSPRRTRGKGRWVNGYGPRAEIHPQVQNISS